MVYGKVLRQIGLPLLFCAYSVGATQTSAPLKSLGPKQIFDRAVRASPAVLNALQKVAEAKARVGEAQAQARPQFSATGTASASRGNLPDTPGSQGFTTYQGSLSLAFPNFRKTAAGRDASRSQLRLAELEVQRSLSDLAFRSNDTYYGLRKAQDALEIARQNKDQAQRLVDDSNKRIAAGDLPPADLLKAQVPAAQAEAALARARNAVTLASQTLNSLMGQPLSSPLSIAKDAETPAFTYTHDDVIARALSGSPDVLEAQTNIETARANLAAARAVNDPTLGLAATQTHTGDPTTYTNLGALSLSLTIPLYDGGVGRAQLREAEAQLAESRSALDLAKQQTILAAESALLDLHSAESDLSSADTALNIAQESAKKALQSFEAGLTTTRDVLDSQLALAQARSDANNAKYALALSRAKLHQVMGDTKP